MKLGVVKDNTHGGIIPLCPTRWIVRANCFKKILGNSNSLQEVWELCLVDYLDAEVRGRVLGCQAQIITFKYILAYIYANCYFPIQITFQKLLNLIEIFLF